MRIIAMLTVMLALTGCSHFVKPSQPSNIAAPCDPLPEFDGENMGDLLAYTVNVVQMYHTCAAKHEAI